MSDKHIAGQTIQAMVEYRVIDGHTFELLIDDDGNKYLKLEDFGIEHQEPNPIIIQSTQADKFYSKMVDSLTHTDYPRLNDIASDEEKES